MFTNGFAGEYPAPSLATCSVADPSVTYPRASARWKDTLTALPGVTFFARAGLRPLKL